jgi:hypothetical protein
MAIISILLLIYLGDIVNIGFMRGRKRERHYRVLWFYEMEKMLFLQFCCVELYVDFIELVSRVKMN